MELQSIQVANNGFILEDAYGEMYIAKNLIEVAQLAGEITPATTTTATYAAGMGASRFSQVKDLAQQGHRIAAIKLLRDCFTPKLGLREAKDLVDSLCC